MTLLGAQNMWVHDLFSKKNAPTHHITNHMRASFLDLLFLAPCPHIKTKVLI